MDNKIVRSLWLLCGGALLALLTAAPAQAQAQRQTEAGWRWCAKEGESCTVQGRTMVRFGATGRWAYKQVRGRVECGNELFGDPAPGAAKRCEVQVGSGGAPVPPQAARGWVFCAAEGEVCRVNGSAAVRFGDGRSYNTRMVDAQAVCGVDNFGDPAYGVTKHCEVRASSAASGGGGAPGAGYEGWEQLPPPSGWRYCAPEGQVCRFQGQAQVRFGEGNDFATRTAANQVACTSRVFGDPAVGRLKHCEIAATASVQRPGVGADAYRWERCADEGGVCSFSGRRQVRFGALGRYVYRDAFNGLRCDLATFDTDPFPQQVKTCEVVR